MTPTPSGDEHRPPPGASEHHSAPSSWQLGPASPPPSPPYPPAPPGAARRGWGLHPASPPPARRGTWGWGEVFLGLGLFIGAQLAAGVVVMVAMFATGAIDPGTGITSGDEERLILWSLAVGSPAGWLALIGVPWWVSRRKGTGSMARDMGLAFRPVDILWGLGSIVVCMTLAAGASVGFELAMGDEPPTNTDIVPSDPGVGTFLLLLALIGIGTPIAEEIFFRGLVLGAARKRSGTLMGVVWSSVLFGLMHILPSTADPGEMSWWIALAFVPVVTGLYGAVWGVLRVVTRGRIAAAIIGHMGVNSAVVVAITQMS